MATYGAKCPMFAPFASADAETATAYPTYGDAITLAELVSSTDAPNFTDVKLHGDNRVVENVTEFKDGTIDVGVTEMSNANASVIFGATLDEESGDLAFGESDAAPFGGYAHYISKSINNKTFHQGIYYPKTKAVPQGESYETKGENITFGTSKLRLNVFAPKYGKWKVKSKDFVNEEEAFAWVKAKLGVKETAAASETNEGEPAADGGESAE